MGGFLLAGPFVVTEDVCVLAANMRALYVATTVGAVVEIGYAARYQADAGRDPDRELAVAGVPVRFISLIASLVRLGAAARPRLFRP